jgi:hypothetical protein
MNRNTVSKDATMTPRRFPRALLLGLLSLIGVALVRAAPLAAQSSCLSVAVSGVPSPRIFADGFESGDTAAWGAPAAPAFSTTATEDLAATVELDPATTGEHLLELRWTLGAEQLYQSVAVPVTAGSAVRPGAARRVAGYPFPVAVAKAVPSRAAESPALAVTSSLPVAGTSIVDAALWGNWQLTAYLDGAEQPCAAPALFRLEP